MQEYYKKLAVLLLICACSCTSWASFEDTVVEVNKVLYGIASGIALLLITIHIVRWKTAGNPTDRNEAKKGIINVIIGLIVITIAATLVTLLFSKPGEGSPDDETTLPVLKCHDGTLLERCSASLPYKGYKCIFSGDITVLVADSSCDNTSSTTSTTALTSTTTTSTAMTSTTTTTTTTLPVDHGTCYNAETDDICSGLNILDPELQDACCSDWECCCNPKSGTCSAP